MMNRYKWEHVLGHSIFLIAKAIGDGYQWQRTEYNAAHCPACYGLLYVYFYEKNGLWKWWCKRCGHAYFSGGDVVQCAICLQQNAKRPQP